ncbi:MAG TPA: radical SAM protein [Fibrobacteria bacterium]|nr:radical SAM protein [Fibrobacteria bacterium]
MASETILANTMAWCVRCGRAETARTVSREGGVFLERLCPAGAAEPVLVAASEAWYRRRVMQPRSIQRPVHPKPALEGCPRDCGPCTRHLSDLRLPIFSITNVCNLDCPICFTHNRPDRAYHKTLSDVERIADHILERNPSQTIVDLTGGEPTLHPQLPEIVALLRSKGFSRVMVNTNGMRLARDADLARALAQMDAHVVLSLDTLDPAASRTIHGADIVESKERCLEALQQASIATTVIFVAIRGVNEHELAPLATRLLARDHVLSITVQNMAYTGANGSRFQTGGRIAMDEVESLLCGVPGIAAEDFHTPDGAHPLCYSMAWFAQDAGRILSLARILPRERLSGASAGSYLPRLDASLVEEFQTGLARAWSEGCDPEDLKVLRRISLVAQDPTLSASRRERKLERSIKMVCVHPHMDGANFDLDRIAHCGDLVPDESGSMVPACSYNLLYRERDERFWKPSP